MKFAFSGNAFRRYSLVKTIEILAGLGYEGIEIMADVPHAYPPDVTEADITEVKKTLDKHGMEISNVNAFMMHAVGDTWHPSWIERDPVLRGTRINYTLACIDLAEKLGAHSISTEPGGPLDGITLEEGWRLFREGLLAIHSRAQEKGIRVLIEPEPDLLIENSKQFLDFFKDLDAAVFGLNFDIGHFYCVGEDPAVLVRKLNGITGHYHLEDIAPSRVHHHLIPGEGSIDLKDVLRCIEGVNYTGFVTVELYPYEEQPIQAARLALQYLHER